MTLFEIVQAARKVLNPQQVCVVCVFFTGGLYTYSVATFARNDEVTQMRIEQLEATAFDTRSKQCIALKQGQSGAAYREKLAELLRKYREIAGGDYNLPTCDEL
jgi:hypothetical protein